MWTVPPEPPNDEIRYIGLTRGLYATVDAARAYDREAVELQGGVCKAEFPGGARPGGLIAGFGLEISDLRFSAGGLPLPAAAPGYHG